MCCTIKFCSTKEKKDYSVGFREGLRAGILRMLRRAIEQERIEFSQRNHHGYNARSPDACR